MEIDWEGSKERWIREVQTGPLYTLRADRRFQAGTLPDRFQQEVTTWRRTKNFRPLIEIGNEIAAACCLLGSMADDDRLEYEPAISGTDRRIDFHQLASDGQHAWVEVKTVSPQWRDDEANWQRFLRFVEDFPDNAELVIRKEWAGAAIAGQYIGTRWSFIRRTVAVEETAALLPDDLKGPVWLLFCARNHDWRSDELEDFSDLYRTGRGRDDDPLRNAADSFMVSEGLGFQRSLAGFHFLGRRDDEAAAFEFQENVNGPDFGR